MKTADVGSILDNILKDLTLYDTGPLDSNESSLEFGKDRDGWEEIHISIAARGLDRPHTIRMTYDVATTRLLRVVRTNKDGTKVLLRPNPLEDGPGFEPDDELDDFGR